MQDLKLDKWQKEVLNHKGNIVCCTGRQVGKTEVVARKAVHYALKHKVSVVIGAAVERQAGILFWRVKDYLKQNYPGKVKGKATLHFIELKNGSKLYCVPIGESGVSIRGLTANMLIIDEAAFVNERAWRAITPLLATTNGQMIFLSTPFGDEGYFIDCMHDPNFRTWNVSSEDCPRITKAFLEGERRKMTELQYAQEYLGKPLAGLKQFFPTALITECLSLQGLIIPTSGSTQNFLGVDVARMGEDETVLFSVRRIMDQIAQIDMEIATKTPVTEVARKIKKTDSRCNFKKIYIDDGGVGGGVYDILREDEQTRRKVVAINNASKSMDYNPDKEIRKKILKEDLYNNLKNLMEHKKIVLLNKAEIEESLRSIQYEYTEDKRLKLFGRYDHIVEAIVRAAWCMKDKSLNIYIY